MKNHNQGFLGLVQKALEVTLERFIHPTNLGHLVNLGLAVTSSPRYLLVQALLEGAAPKRGLVRGGGVSRMGT